MLQHVVEYARQHVKDSEVGFARREILWRVQLATDGSLLNIEPVQDSKAKPRRTWPCPEMHKMNAVGKAKRAHFLVEYASTLFVYDTNKKSAPSFSAFDDAKTVGRHKYFVKLLDAAATEVVALGPLVSFLRSEQQLSAARVAAQKQGVKPGDWVQFAHDGYDPLTDTAVLDWWRKWLASDAAPKPKDGQGSRAREKLLPIDLLTGEPCFPAETHPPVRGMTKGLGKDGGDSQAPLVAMNKGAYQSFGLSSGENASMSKGTAQLYADGLSDLIRKAEIIAGAKVIYWYRRALKNDELDPIFALLSATYSAESDRASALISARKLLTAIRSGERPTSTENEYFAMTLSGLKGRVMVRDWMEGDFADLLASSLRWFDDLQVVTLAGTRTASEPKFETVATSMLPEKSPARKYGDWVKPIGPARSGLFRAALDSNVPIPSGAIVRIVDELRRFMISESARKALFGRTENNGNESDGLTVSRLYARMGLIKAYFIRNPRGGDSHMKPYLNPDHPDPAYHCGRLLAVLAKLQEAALGEVGAGVVQRYYPAFSQAPALYLGRLVANARNHLSKIPSPDDRDRFQVHLEAIHGRLEDAAPAILGLEGQGLFAIGYYQQLAARRADAKS